MDRVKVTEPLTGVEMTVDADSPLVEQWGKSPAKKAPAKKAAASKSDK